MGTIAKGEITLSPVNDAYTVSITPASCTIKADFDGSNPQLDNAKGTITIKRGTRDVPFHVVAPHISTGGSVAFANQTSSIVAFEVTSLPNNVLNGTVGFDIKTDDGFDYQTTVQFAFTIVRESTMLDWIKDWEGSKTKVGGTYIMTPKMFVGKKEDIVDSSVTPPIWKEGALTGIYIGPDILSSQETSAGIYGYLKDNEIFHINADGGFIGGWTFNEAGLQSSNGVVNILAEGSIFAKNPNSTTEYWGIYADGHATFANGNVKFMANGSAEYAGKITSTSGKIGGWSLSKNQLHSGRIILDSANGYIGVYDSDLILQDWATGDWNFPTNPIGGVKLWYSSASDFGFAAWAAGKKVFQLGASNMIAGWNFNHQAIWTGSESPYLAQGSFATNSGELTLAPNGIRSTKWYMDADGTAQFVEGKVQFNENNAEMFGWKMYSGRFSAPHAALVSDSYNNGVYVSSADLSEIASTSLRNTIHNFGGIYIWSDAASSMLCAYDKSGNLGFALRTTGYHSIGNWYFDHESIYTGSTNLSPEGFTMTPGSLILSTDGLIGYLWKLNGDGSGAIAGGNISWDAEGNVTFANSVSLNWVNISSALGNKLTKIDANGIYTGTISADNITAGTITTAAIKNGIYWALNTDGSGYLASSKISWTDKGVLSIANCKLKDVVISGSIATPFTDGYFIFGSDGGSLSVGTLGLQNNNCVIIPGDSAGWYTAFQIPFNSAYNGFRAIIINHDWNGTKATGPISATAPSGKYFHEDGESMSELIINPYEAVELIGVGEGDSFKGWLVLNRRIYGHPTLSIGEGFALKAMYMGVIKYNADTKAPSLRLQRRWDEKMYGRENKRLILSYPNSLRGSVTIQIPEGVFSSADKYEVFLTTCKNGVDSVNGYACVENKTAKSFDIWTSDDTTWNSIDITFYIVGTWNMS